jgi:glycosyltransferase involved in cell wall biosynthesis
MPSVKVPEWVQRHLVEYDSVDDIPDEVFARIRKGFDRINSQTAEPYLTVGMIAWNEEKNILANLSSLSELQCSRPFEVLVVNNNSTDRTQEILDRCGVKSVMEKQQGYGFARQAGINVARGKYFLTGDADSIYPPGWPDEMLKAAEQEGVVGAYGMCSFLPNENRSRLSFAFYELLKDTIVKARAVNRPELNVMGMTFCFETRLAKEIGFPTDNRRGEDGRMAWAMKKHGKLVLVKSKKSRVWTITRTIDYDGSMLNAIAVRAKKEIMRFKEYLAPQKGEYKERV